MFNLKHKKKATATLEYVMLIVFVLGAFVVFNKYITRAMAGRWKSIGESFSMFRQYYPKSTIRCAYDYVYLNVWYNADCFEQKCDCFTIRKTPATCQTCIQLN